MDYKIPKITADGIIINDDEIVLIKRKNDPFKGKWALPGGYVEYGESTEEAVKREVFEETGLKTNISKLVGVYSDPSRDPRGHTITVVYLLNALDLKFRAGDDASDVKLFKLQNLPDLSFDHELIIKEVKKRFL